MFCPLPLLVFPFTLFFLGLLLLFFHFFEKSRRFLDEVGIDNWNEFEDHYAFVYTNPEKGSSKVLVKCLVMNGKFVVDALADGSSEPVDLEIEYLSFLVFSLFGLY